MKLSGPRKLLDLQNGILLTAVLLAVTTIPAVWFGPMLPFLDFIAFSALNSYPPLRSYGPDQFYLFQYTYIIPHVLSRTMTNFNIGVPMQVLIYYLLHLGVFFFGLRALLWSLIPAASIRHLALAFGALAFWDALFIWGGPLAYSLAACLWVLALAFSLHDAQRGEARPLLVFLLLFLALLSHPFAAIFVLPLAGLRLLLIPKRRAAEGASLLLLAGYSLLILRDSAEPAAAGGLSALFSLFNAQPAARIFSLFTQDADMLRSLFDSVPLPVLYLLEFYSFIRLIGYLASPWLLWRHRREPHLVLLLTINTIVFVLFLCSNDNEVVNTWPKRLVSFNGIPSFACGVFAVWQLFLAPRLWAHAGLRKLRYAPFLAVPVLLAAEYSLFSFSRPLQKAADSLTAEVLGGEIDNAFLTVRGFDNLQPFLFRALPMLLFSHPEVVKRNALVSTEWHNHPRHNTRLADNGYRTGRTRKFIRLSMDGGVPSAAVDVERPTAFAHLRVRFGGAPLPLFEPAAPLFTTGAVNDANFLFVTSPRPGVVRLGFDRWGRSPVYSGPVFVDFERTYNMDISYGPAMLSVALDGVHIFSVDQPLATLTPVQLGANTLGGNASLAKFMGSLEVQSGVDTSPVKATVAVQNPQGFDLVGGRQLYWLGNEPAVITVNTPADGDFFDAQLDLAVQNGPSNPDPRRTLRLTDLASGAIAEQSFTGSAKMAIPLPLAPGRNRFRLAVIYPAGATVEIARDPRKLLVLVESVGISSRSR